MTKKTDRVARDDNAPAAAVVDDATERHLVNARELLRQARSRLSVRDDGAVDANGKDESNNDSEESP